MGVVLTVLLLLAMVAFLALVTWALLRHEPRQASGGDDHRGKSPLIKSWLGQGRG